MMSFGISFDSDQTEIMQIGKKAEPYHSEKIPLSKHEPNTGFLHSLEVHQDS